MADWDGLRSGLEEGVSPPPLGALRQRRRRRQQRRAAAATLSLVLVGTATGLTVLGGDSGKPSRPVALPTATSTPNAADRFVNGVDVPVPPDYDQYVVTDVDFVSPDLGWAIGLRCVGDRCDVATWKTEDGGTTWQPPRPVATKVPRSSFHEQDPAGGAARSIKMANDRDGFAFNPDLYVTHDGGTTWRRVPQPTKVAYVQMQGPSVWLLERGCARDVDCDAVLREGTLGPGFTPRDVTLPPTNGAAAAVRRESPERAFLVTWQPAEGEPAFHATTDGGRTWAARTHPCADADTVSLSAGLGRPLWVVCSTGDARTAYQSSDDGGTWRRTGSLPEKAEVTDLIAVTATGAYATTQQPARLLRTTDSGATWTPVKGAALTGYGYGNLDVADVRHAWAMGDAGLLWRTTDGETWERLFLPPRSVRAKPAAAPLDKNVQWTSLSFTDALRGWALGRACTGDTCRSVLRRTVDGGVRWQAANAPTQTYVSEAGPPTRWDVSTVTFVDDRTGWLTGEDTLVTHDGGATWKRLPHDRLTDLTVTGGTAWALEWEGCAGTPCNPQPIRWTVATDAPLPFTGPGLDLREGSLAVADANHVYVAGHDPGTAPRLAATSDGGKTWSEYAVPCAAAFSVDLAAYAPGRLWALCGDETENDTTFYTVVRSADGGSSWEHSPENDDYSGYGAELWAFGSEDAWRFDGGGLGALRRTKNGGATWTEGPKIPGATTFLDVTHGWTVIDGATWRTTDGVRWVRLG